MSKRTLNEWIDYTKSLHPLQMDLSLERVTEVAKDLNLLSPGRNTITVAGTNGKGSTVAGLEAIYLAQGYKVGAFTSPFLFQFNEQIRIQGKALDDESLCAAFERIDQGRNKIGLTPFEFNTLVALDIFYRESLDVCILEVGLGGRYDAVNAIDTDCAIVTSIAIDHVAWLGDTRELIAREKAGICRAQVPVICGDPLPPQSLCDYAETLEAPLFCQEKEFSYHTQETTWSWTSQKTHYENLPIPVLALQNMSTVLMAIDVLQNKCPVTEDAIKKGLRDVKLVGRIQIVEGPVTKIFDVSHNPASAELLAKKLAALPCVGKTIAVFSMLGDKDIKGTIQTIKNQIDEWHIAELKVERGAAIENLLSHFADEEIPVNSYQNLEEAYHSATQLAKPGDRVIVFGSFHSVFCCL
ncbi:MAG: bifunctional tetrahydrofolate synthase/dihydrofolate synthase [Gammaproteobacteria bacterium]|nr:bifunctional tetrahydrofolate synthase/dihydrofolate synthase [Gammaproteobacteria bacterium]